MSIQRITMRNLSVFSNGAIPLAKQVNVFIGENGTGKTQLLKSIYGTCKMTRDGNIRWFTNCFLLNSQQCTLVRNRNDGITTFGMMTTPLTKRKGQRFFCADMKLHEGDIPIQQLQEHITSVYEIQYPDTAINATYIPVKDMLTHAKGLLSMSKRYKDFPFDDTLLDIIDKSNQWVLKEPPRLAVQVLPVLEQLMDGTVVIENEEFYIQKHDGRKVSFELEAEGLKKIGLLWQLLMNESITEDSVLLWDEPEANLNPNFIPQLVDMLLILSRNGVQVCVSTHSYIFAKYVEIKATDTDKVLFHSLYKDNGLVYCESEGTFKNLTHNSIMSSFAKLMDDIYDAQVNQ